MKKISTLVLGIVVLTSFLFFEFRVNALAVRFVPYSNQTEVKRFTVSSTSFIKHNSGDAELNYSWDID